MKIDKKSPSCDTKGNAGTRRNGDRGKSDGRVEKERKDKCVLELGHRFAITSCRCTLALTTDRLSDPPFQEETFESRRERGRDRPLLAGIFVCGSVHLRILVKRG